MTIKNLTKKPLIEALFEIRWQSSDSGQSTSLKNTQLILAKLFERISSHYPKYEELSSAYHIPYSMAQGVIKYRFRSEQGWPLVQLGQQILTVNDTENYLWDDFKTRVIDAVNDLYSVYPDQKQFQVTKLVLKYINAIDINAEDNIYTLLREKMQFNLSLNENLFHNNKTSINQDPLELDLRFAFKCNEPKGVFNFRLLKGQKNNDAGKYMNDALIWETAFQSSEDNLPQIPLGLSEWLIKAHSATEHWFFTLVEGDLLRSFKS